MDATDRLKLMNPNRLSTLVNPLPLGGTIKRDIFVLRPPGPLYTNEQNTNIYISDGSINIYEYCGFPYDNVLCSTLYLTVPNIIQIQGICFCWSIILQAGYESDAKRN